MVHIRWYEEPLWVWVRHDDGRWYGGLLRCWVRWPTGEWRAHVEYTVSPGSQFLRSVTADQLRRQDPQVKPTI